jgi:hypothetical protein
MMVAPLNVKQPQVQDTTLNLQEVIAETGLNCDVESQKLEELLTEYRDIFPIFL